MDRDTISQIVPGGRQVRTTLEPRNKSQSRVAGDRLENKPQNTDNISARNPSRVTQEEERGNQTAAQPAVQQSVAAEPPATGALRFGLNLAIDDILLLFLIFVFWDEGFDGDILFLLLIWLFVDGFVL